MYYNTCMKKQSFIIVFIAFLSCFSLFAQEYFFDNYVYQSWNAFGTLNGTSATDIIQTSDGYINIGTYEGLARFDGMNFTTHKRSSDNDLTFVSVRAILEDSQGNLWIGSNDEGLQRISPEGKKTYTTKNGLPNNSIRCLAEDQSGNVWVGTAAGVVYNCKRNNCRFFILRYGWKNVAAYCKRKWPFLIHRRYFPYKI